MVSKSFFALDVSNFIKLIFWLVGTKLSQRVYTLQGLHESLTFTVEHEQDNQLPFMDVAVSRPKIT